MDARDIPLIFLARLPEVPDALRAKMLSSFSSAKSSKIAALTEAERDVLTLIVAGMQNKNIAKTLNVSVRAIEDRRARMMRRLEVNSIAALVKLAIDEKIA